MTVLLLTSQRKFLEELSVLKFYPILYLFHQSDASELILFLRHFIYTILQAPYDLHLTRQPFTKC